MPGEVTLLAERGAPREVLSETLSVRVLTLGKDEAVDRPRREGDLLGSPCQVCCGGLALLAVEVN